MERVRVQWRDFEIVPGLRDGEAAAWSYVAPDTGTLGRSYLLVDLGVKLTIPPVWIERGDPIWYLDLALVFREGDLYRVLDLDLDVFVPTDRRPYRMLDLDEFADAIEAGEFTLAEAMDGLRRWQRFLDSHLHRFATIETGRSGQMDVQPGWRDFPPAAIGTLMNLPDEAFAH